MRRGGRLTIVTVLPHGRFLRFPRVPLPAPLHVAYGGVRVAMLRVVKDTHAVPPLLEHAIRDRLRALEDALVRHRAGRITDDELRAMRLALCLHQEADPARFMLRVRIPGGEARAGALTTIAALARAAAETRPVHLTTRQCFQVHHLALEEAPAAIRFLLGRGLATTGTCGNAVRNVAVCERAGICRDEVGDVRDVARALADTLAMYPGHALPRKFKIAVSGCARDCAGSIMHDAGWVARDSDGADGPTFDLWGGGGLGARPRAAVPLAEGVPADRVVEVTRALIDLFDHQGDRQNRKRARLKFVIERLGSGEVRARLHAAVGALPAPRMVAAATADELAGPVSDAASRWSRSNVVAESRAGRFTCGVTVPEGDVTPDQLDAVAEVARRFGDGTVRLTAEQNLLLPGVPSERIEAVRRTLTARGLGQAGAGWAADPVSCPGRDVCALAFTRSRGASRAIRERLAREPSLVDALGPYPVRVSGCPNGCARHATAALGFQGILRGGKPFYRVWLGAQGSRVLARPQPGAVSQEDLPERAVELLRAKAQATPAVPR